MDWTELLPIALNVILGGGLLKVWLESKSSASKTDMDRACELIAALQKDNERLRLALAQQDKAISELRAEHERQIQAYETRIDDLEAQVNKLQRDNVTLKDSLAAYQNAQQPARRR